MRIAELSEASGLPVATLKYYLREGLLHPGAARAVNQADYDESHVRRVRLIRALVGLGNLQLAEIKQVLAAVDDETVPLHDALGIAQDAMVPVRDRDAASYERAIAEVNDFVARHALSVRPQAHVRLMLADALVAVRSGGWDFDLRAFDERMPRVLAEARLELSGIPTDDRVRGMEAAVIGTISYEVAVSALRRMALEHASAARLAHEPGSLPERAG